MFVIPLASAAAAARWKDWMCGGNIRWREEGVEEGEVLVVAYEDAADGARVGDEGPRSLECAGWPGGLSREVE